MATGDASMSHRPLRVESGSCPTADVGSRAQGYLLAPIQNRRSLAGEGPREEETPNDLDVVMGEHIRVRRKALAMTQAALAAAVGLSYQQIQKYERGSNRISFSKLVEVARALDCRVTDLIGELDQAAPQPAFRQDTAQLRAAGARELLAAFSHPPRGMRRRVLELARRIARDQPRPLDM